MEPQIFSFSLVSDIKFNKISYMEGLIKIKYFSTILPTIIPPSRPPQSAHHFLKFVIVFLIIIIVKCKGMEQPSNHFSITLSNPSTTKAAPPNMIALKKIQNYCYALTDQIGLGFTSHVYRGKNQLTNEPVAVKVIDLKNHEDELHNHFMNEEVTVLEKIKNANPQNLLRLQCVIKTKNNLYIITELCQGKDLGKILRKRRKLPQGQAQSIMKQLLNGYKELYELELIHRDLKLANLFISKGKVKIADFGFTISQNKSHEKMEYNVGSPYYMAPEALKYNRYSYKSDVWGLGVIAYHLVFGRVPWREKNDSLLFQMITTTPIQTLFDSEVILSEDYRAFIKKCLTIDFNKRTTPSEIINYEWPLAKEHVDGMAEDIPRYSSIGLPPVRNMNKAQITLNEPKYQSLSKQKKTPILIPRNQSPLNKQEKINVHGKEFHLLPVKIDEKMVDEDSSDESSSNLTEIAILGQLHFCRFMLSLSQKLELIPKSPQINEIRLQLCGKIADKMKTLGEIVRTQKNMLKSPGFLKYTRKPQWENLKQLIIKYDIKFREELKFDDMKMNTFNPQNLKNTIFNMKANLPHNWRILELLTYYYQLKEMEVKENYHGFSQRSKIQFLAAEGRKSLEQFVEDEHSERLRKKLDFMFL